jgi:hypothetical protein
LLGVQELYADTKALVGPGRSPVRAWLIGARCYKYPFGQTLELQCSNESADLFGCNLTSIPLNLNSYRCVAIPIQNKDVDSLIAPKRGRSNSKAEIREDARHDVFVLLRVDIEPIGISGHEISSEFIRWDREIGDIKILENPTKSVEISEAAVMRLPWGLATREEAFHQPHDRQPRRAAACAFIPAWRIAGSCEPATTVMDDEQ